MGIDQIPIEQLMGPFIVIDVRERSSRPSSLLLARIIHECRRDAFETEARRGFSHVRPTQAYSPSVEEAKREKFGRARGSDDGAGIHE